LPSATIAARDILLHFQHGGLEFVKHTGFACELAVGFTCFRLFSETSSKFYRFNPATASAGLPYAAAAKAVTDRPLKTRTAIPTAKNFLNFDIFRPPF
jgi:hypothetical protein